MHSKKILSFILAGMMTVSSFSFAFGEVGVVETKFADVTGDYGTAIGILTSLNVIDGYEDGTFKPEKTITRAELAKVLVETLGYGSLVNGAKSDFMDTQGHWADGYISIASGTDLVKGDGNGNFRPDATVTYDEAFTMIVRALGYTDEVVKGTWPTNFKIKATELDLTDDVVMSTSGADRGGVAQALYNALEVATVKVNTDGDVNYQMKADGKTPKVLLDSLSDFEEDYIVSPDTLNEDSKNYGGNMVDLSDYMYQSVKAYINDDKEVVYVKENNSLVVVGTVDKDATDLKVLNVKDAEGDSVKVAFNADTKLFYNGNEETSYDMNDLTTLNDVPNVAFDKVIVVGKDSNDNNKIDVDTEIQGVIVEQQTEATVIENVYKAGKDNIDIFDLPVDTDGEVDLTKVTITGDAKSLKEIQIDDVVVAYESLNGEDLKLVVTRGNVLKGKIKRVDVADKEVYVDNVAKEFNKAANDVYNNSTDEMRLELGNEGTFFLDHNDKIVGFDGVTTERADYGVVIAVAPGLLKDGAFDWEIEELPAIKLATADDEAVVFEVELTVDEEDGKVDDSAVYDTTDNSNELDLLITSGTAVNFADATIADLAKGQLVKYNVNKDGKIDAITLVDEDTLTGINTESKAFVLADNVVIFENDNTKFPVIIEDYLDASINGTGLYNKDGELEVILVNSADIDNTADETTMAYLEKATDIGTGYNDDEDIVQIPVLFVNGEEKEFYTEKKDTFSGLNAAIDGGIYELEFDENGVIVKATIQTTTDAVVKSVNSKGTLVQLIVGAVTEWYGVAEYVTMVDTTGKTIDLIESTDLDDSAAVKVVITDGEIAYLQITK